MLQENEDHVSGFKLERVGQYLKDEDLTDPPETWGNMWGNFLIDNPKVAGNINLLVIYINNCDLVM